MRRPVMRSASSFTAFAAATGTLLIGGSGPAVKAAEMFQAINLNQSAFVVVAAPIGTSGQKAQLHIYEQVKPARPCYQLSGSNPTRVDPLLVGFNFSGICSRYIDSVGYSTRVGSEDLFRTYRLVVRKTPSDNVLVATAGPSKPEMLVARTNGTGGPTEFLELKFEPGWRLMRRSYGGRALGHVYLYSDTWPSGAAAIPAAAAPAPAPAPAAASPVAAVKPQPAAIATPAPAPTSVQPKAVKQAAVALSKPSARLQGKGSATPMASTAMALYAPAVSIACTPVAGVPTTAGRGFGKTIPLMTWYPSSFDRAGWTPQKRCDTVSQKLDAIRQRGQLNYLTTGTVKRQSVICAVDQPRAACSSGNMIMTLEKGQNPSGTLLALVQLQPSDKGVSQVGQDKVLINVPVVMEERLRSLPKG